MLAGIVPPIEVSASVSVTVHNPLGQIAPVDNQPLAERLTQAELATARIALVSYTKQVNPEVLAAIGLELRNLHPGIQLSMYSLGGPWDAKSMANYAFWATYDAVILGVQD